jgi:hypothetical protein
MTTKRTTKGRKRDLTMDSNIVKFPFVVSRRAHARKPRWSKNGTPEERAAKAAVKPTAATVIEISRPSVIAGTAAPAEQLDPWFEAELLLKKLNDQKLLPAGLECMRLLLERYATS